MNWVPWLILVIVMGMLAYPIMMIVPTKGQKRLIALRSAVASQGIEIEVRNPKLAPELRSDYAHMERCVAYRLRCFDTVLNQNFIALRGNHSGDWFWLNKTRPPARLVEKLLPVYRDLPDYCKAVEQGPSGSAVFVREAFPPEEAKTLYALLTKLNQTIHN